MTSKRLYVGNLNSTTTETDIQNLFLKFGSVASVELRNKIVDNNHKYFAFVDLQVDDSIIPRVIKRLSGTKWKGQEIAIQVAKESFMQRLQKERAESRNLTEHSFPKKTDPYPKRRSNFGETHPNKVIKFDDDFDSSIKQPVIHINDDQPSEVNVKVKTDEERRAEDNKRRLQSLNEKKNQMKQQQILIKAALSRGKQLSKRVVFDEKEMKKESTKKPLFDDENDNEDISNVSFNDKLGNRKSEKLISLQSKFAHDSRFKINEKFIEDDKFDEEEINKDDVDNEAEHNISVLEKVLGKSLKRPPPPSDNNKPWKRSLIIPRFDPSKSVDTEKYEVKKKSKESKIEEQPNDKEETAIEATSKERYYEVSSSLKNIWKNDEESGNTFSFSKTFGNTVDEDQDTIETDKCVPLRKKAKALDETQPSADQLTDVPFSTSSEYSFHSEKFFFDDDDPRFANDSFFNEENFKLSDKDWNTLKIAAIEVLARRRRFLKRKIRSRNLYDAKGKSKKFKNFKTKKGKVTKGLKKCS